MDKVDGIEEIIRASFQGLSLPAPGDVLPISKITGWATEVVKGGVGAQVENEHAEAEKWKMLVHFTLTIRVRRAGHLGNDR